MTDSPRTSNALDVRGGSVIELLKSQLFLLTGNNDGGWVDGEFLGQDSASGASESHRLHFQTGSLLDTNSCGTTSTGTSGETDASGSDSGRDATTESEAGEGCGTSNCGTSGTGTSGQTGGTSGTCAKTG